MKVAFVGKGGSGKTTLSALFCRYLAASGVPVTAVDADINQHLGAALGMDPAEPAPPALGSLLPAIKDFLRGDNARISSAAAMVKTTPPGRGSRLVRPGGNDPFHTEWSRNVHGVRLLVTGQFADDDLGVSCYHAKVGAVELYLNHLVDDRDQYVVVDMTAGADAFASGLFTRFDTTVIVVEPTRKSVGVYRQYLQRAQGYGIRLVVVGNKVTGPSDAAFLREEVGSDLLVWLGSSDHVRAMEQGRSERAPALEPANAMALDRIRRHVDGGVRDWARFSNLAAEFHLRNARAWANAAVGCDLTDQIDPDFVLGPSVLPADSVPTGT